MGGMETQTAITAAQIRQLGIEAFEAGDYATFDLTALALEGDTAAREACAKAIAAADEGRKTSAGWRP